MIGLLMLAGYLAITMVVAYLIARFCDEAAAPLSLLWPFAPLAGVVALLLYSSRLGAKHAEAKLRIAKADGGLNRE